MAVKQPSIERENAAQAEGYSLVAGLDEAGRGALAGPVSAGAVILPTDDSDLLRTFAGVRDSKLCTAKQREELYTLICDAALTVGVGLADASEVDEHGIIGATRLAMRRALESLTPAPDFLLIDGRMRLPTLPTPQVSIIRGDQVSLSIAAASICAKVVRDRLLVEADDRFPEYGFARHKGYATADHRLKLREHGPCEYHRFTFAPVSDTTMMDGIRDA